MLDPIIAFTDAVLDWADVNSCNPDAAEMEHQEDGGFLVRVPRSENFACLFHFDGNSRVDVKKRANRQTNWVRYTLDEFVALVEGGERFA